MKERNENLHISNFYYPFPSFGHDDDVIFISTKFWMRRKNGRILEFVLTLAFLILDIQLNRFCLEA